MTTIEDPTVTAVGPRDDTVRAIADRVIARRPHLDLNEVCVRVQAELERRRNDRVQVYTSLLVSGQC